MIIQRMVEGYQRADHPYVTKLAVPIPVPNHCFEVKLLSTDALVYTVGCLAIIEFLYLLCVGAYTKPRYVIRGGKRVIATQTQNFSVGDV